MTKEEFDEWWKDMKSRFPDSVRWATTDRKLEEVQAIWRTWFEVLDDCRLEDCLYATKAIQRGDEAAPQKFEAFPQSVRAIARKRSAERSGRSGGDFVPKRGVAISGLSKLLAEAIEAKANGESEESHLQRIENHFKQHTPPISQPRFSCLACLDSGMKTVYTNAFINHVRNGGSVADYKRTKEAVCRCQCEKGYRRDELRNGIPRYSIKTHYPAIRGATAERIRKHVLEWLEENTGLQAAMSNGNESLASWNRG